MKRCQLSSIDGRSVFLLKAVEEEPAILEIATDDRPGTTTFPAARHRYALLVYPSTQVGVDQTLRHFINRRAQHLITDAGLSALAVDSKLRSCDVVRLRVHDVTHGERMATRAIVMQQKTQRPVQFEITEQTRDALASWIRRSGLRPEDFLFPSRLRASLHLSTRQYARIVRGWVREIGLDPAAYGTHTLRRTKATLIYRRTKNLRAVQLLLGHTKVESTVRYLCVEVDDALEMAEQTEV